MAVSFHTLTNVSLISNLTVVATFHGCIGNIVVTLAKKQLISADDAVVTLTSVCQQCYDMETVVSAKTESRFRYLRPSLAAMIANRQLKPEDYKTLYVPILAH
jgi:hypothetical protein